MQKIKINVIVNGFSFLSLLVVFATGIALWVFMPGSKGAGRVSLWGLDRHVWKDWHNWGGVIFTGLMLLHLILHFSWIKSIPKFFSKQEIK